VLDERNDLLRQAAGHFAGVSDREASRRIREALSRYREGRWRRDRVEALCPQQHAGKLVASLWALLKTKDSLPSERLIRAVLARS
jgi:hypothetical protein